MPYKAQMGVSSHKNVSSILVLPTLPGVSDYSRSDWALFSWMSLLISPTHTLERNDWHCRERLCSPSRDRFTQDLLQRQHTLNRQSHRARRVWSQLLSAMKRQTQARFPSIKDNLNPRCHNSASFLLVVVPVQLKELIKLQTTTCLSDHFSELDHYVVMRTGVAMNEQK